MAKQNRNYRLTVEGEAGKIYTISRPFTVEFDITRNAFASANVGNIRVMNLSQNTREAIRKNWDQYAQVRRVRLEAGYGDNLSTIFVGKISEAQSLRNRETVVTTIEAFDAGFDLTNAISSVSFPAGTPYRKVASEVLRKGLPGIPIGAVGALEGTVGSTLRGNAYFDNTSSLMEQLTPGCFFVDNEVAYVLGKKEVLKGAVPKIKSSEGLLNTPIRQQTKVLVDIIFEPKLRVGQLLELESETERNVNGQYKVIGIRHHGIISEAVGGTLVTSLELLSDSPWTTVRERGG